jgi:acetylornithine deacetylase
MPLDLVSTLSDLVALPSVNPMGYDAVRPDFFEYRVTDYLQQLLNRFQIATCRQPIAPLRENLLARLDGDVPPEDGGELLLLDAHQDTVGVEGMTIEPWTPTIRDGRLYGRGSCDVKGGLTAMLGALVRLAEERAKLPAGGVGPRPTIVLACTVNEEHGFSGAKGLIRLWSEASGGFLPRAPDGAIIAEPTQLKIVVAHKGMVRWRCHTHGRAAHSSNPAAGDNAIYRMARVVDLVERYGREMLPRQGEHPLCGRPTLSVGTITGGSGVNTVPDRCTIEIDHRLLPGDDPQIAWRRAVDYVSAALGDEAAAAHVEHEPPLMHSGGLSDVANCPLADRLASAIREVTGAADRIGVPFGTNAAILSAAGVPTVVFGPGSIEQAHTADEWIALDQLPQASEILYWMLRFGQNQRSN